MFSSCLWGFSLGIANRWMAENGKSLVCCAKHFAWPLWLPPCPQSSLCITLIICVESCVLVTAFLKKSAIVCAQNCKHTNTYIFFHLTQLKHSDMSGNTCETKKPRKWRENSAEKIWVGVREERFNCNAIEEQFVKLVHMHTDLQSPICPHHQLTAGDIHQDKEVSDAPDVLCGWHYKI